MHLIFSFSLDVLYTLTDLGIYRNTKVTSTSAQVSCAFIIIKICGSINDLGAVYGLDVVISKFLLGRVFMREAKC